MNNMVEVFSKVLRRGWGVVSLALLAASLPAGADTGFTPPRFLEGDAAINIDSARYVALSTLTGIGLVVLVVVVAVVAVFLLRRRIPSATEAASTRDSDSKGEHGDTSK